MVLSLGRKVELVVGDDMYEGFECGLTFKGHTRLHPYSDDAREFSSRLFTPVLTSSEEVMQMLLNHGIISSWGL